MANPDILGNWFRRGDGFRRDRVGVRNRVSEQNLGGDTELSEKPGFLRTIAFYQSHIMGYSTDRSMA
ncbi:MAG: hypothetical protein ACRCT1_13830 [Microcoleaceae cyanobacterium]